MDALVLLSPHVSTHPTRQFHYDHIAQCFIHQVIGLQDSISRSESLEFLKASSPFWIVTHDRSILSPIYLVHSKEDVISNVNIIRKFVQMIRLHPLSSSSLCYIEMKGSAHLFPLRDTFQSRAVCQGMSNFIRKSYEQWLEACTTTSHHTSISLDSSSCSIDNDNSNPTTNNNHNNNNNNGDSRNNDRNEKMTMKSIHPVPPITIPTNNHQNPSNTFNLSQSRSSTPGTTTMITTNETISSSSLPTPPLSAYSSSSSSPSTTPTTSRPNSIHNNLKNQNDEKENTTRRESFEDRGDDNDNDLKRDSGYNSINLNSSTKRKEMKLKSKS